MSTKKYTDALLKQYYHWKLSGMSAQSFCEIKGLDRASLSIAYGKWKRRKG